MPMAACLELAQFLRNNEAITFGSIEMLHVGTEPPVTPLDEGDNVAGGGAAWRCTTTVAAPLDGSGGAGIGICGGGREGAPDCFVPTPAA